MPAKYFEFIDGQRLPGNRVKEFLMNQAVIQCENANEIQGSGIEAYGVRVAINKANGSIWVYMDVGGWTPLSNIFQQELDYEDLATELTAVYNARGTFLTQIDKDELSGETLVAYNAALTAQGLAVTADNKATGAVNTANLTAQGLTVTNQNVDSLGNRVTTAESTLTATNLTLTTTTNTANDASSRVNAITDISAGEIVVRKGPVVKAINGTTNETTIDGGNITTNTINVNRLQAGTLTGFRIQTSSSGQRVVISESTNSVVFFDSTSERGRIQGGTTLNIDATGNGTAMQVNGSTIFSINSSGVALSPGAQFTSDVNSTGSIRAASQLSSNGGYAGTGCTLGTNILSKGNITADGTLSIGGTADVGSTLNVGGGIFRTQLVGGGTTGASFNNSGALVRTSSSQRYKQDVQNLAINYEDILALEPKKFRRIDEVEENENAKYYPGFIAEDLAGTPLDIFVFYSEDENGNLQPEGIHYPELTAALVSAIKEQDSRLNAIEARLAALEAGE